MDISQILSRPPTGFRPGISPKRPRRIASASASHSPPPTSGDGSASGNTSHQASFTSTAVASNNDSSTSIPRRESQHGEQEEEEDEEEQEHDVNTHPPSSHPARTSSPHFTYFDHETNAAFFPYDAASPTHHPPPDPRPADERSRSFNYVQLDDSAFDSLFDSSGADSEASASSYAMPRPVARPRINNIRDVINLDDSNSTSTSEADAPYRVTTTQPAKRRRRRSPTSTSSATATRQSGSSTAAKRRRTARGHATSSIDPATIQQVNLVDSDNEETAPAASASAKLLAEQVASQVDAPPAEATKLTASTCAVCMSQPREATATACGHLFCRACLVQWVNHNRDQTRKRPTCPSCRSTISLQTSGRAKPTIINLQFKRIKKATQPTSS